MPGPNDILAVEYLKQLKLLSSAMQPVTVKRKGEGYHSRQLNAESRESFASATAVRREILNHFQEVFPSGFRSDDQQCSCGFGSQDQKTRLQYGPDGLTALIEMIPEAAVFLSEETIAVMEKYRNQKPPLADDFYTIAAGRILTSSPEELSEIYTATEGLENRMKKALPKAGSMEELVALVRSKRYTETRIRRLLIHTAVGLTKEKYDRMQQSKTIAGKVLGFSEKGAELLRTVKKRELSEIPLVTNLNREPLSGELEEIVRMSILASDIYHLAAGRKLYDRSDYRMIPFVKNISSS